MSFIGRFRVCFHALLSLSSRRAAATLLLLLAALGVVPANAAASDTIKLGFNYPRTGPYFREGLDQLRGAQMALEEINGSGGVMGKKLELVMTDSQSQSDVTKKNVTELIDKHGVKMVFGGSASNVAVAAGEVCQAKGVPFFGTLTYSNTTTGTDGHRFTFRECYNAWMGAKVLSKYLKENFGGKKYFYITADYNWGWSTEDSLRIFTNTTDKSIHKATLTPFPKAEAADFKKALMAAAAEKPDVLALVLFGNDMVNAINIATGMGLKKKMQIVVPNLTLAMAEGAGAKNMEDVVGALPWDWSIPYKYSYPKGIKFVETFSRKFNRYPSTSAASSYTIVHEWAAAVRRAKSFEGAAVVKALEGHTYQSLKDAQTWRDFDHQSVQTVYAVKCNSPAVVNKDKFKLNYFTVLDEMSGEEAAHTRKEWDADRAAANKPLTLEKLPGEK